MATSMKTKNKSKRTMMPLQTEANDAADNNTELDMKSYENAYLKQEIEQYPNYSTVIVMFRRLTERDMEFIVQEAIIKKQCKGLKINQTKMTSACALILADALNNTENILHELSLFDNRVGDQGVYYLSKALSINNNHLMRLDLSKNEITNIGAKHLADMIKTNETLTALCIASNQIGNEGIQILVNAIQYYGKNIMELDFCKNELVNDSVVDSLIQLIKYSQSLKKLFLFNCNLSQNGKDRLLKMQKKKKISGYLYDCLEH